MCGVTGGAPFNGQFQITNNGLSCHHHCSNGSMQNLTLYSMNYYGYSDVYFATYNNNIQLYGGTFNNRHSDSEVNFEQCLPSGCSYVFLERYGYFNNEISFEICGLRVKYNDNITICIDPISYVCTASSAFSDAHTRTSLLNVSVRHTNRKCFHIESVEEGLIYPGDFLGDFQTPELCAIEANMQNCASFMFSEAYRTWGCWCCRWYEDMGDNGLGGDYGFFHSLWDVYDAHPPVYTSVRHTNTKCNSQETFLGEFQTPQLCAREAKMQNCTSFMFSEADHTWGCWCCLQPDSVIFHSLWDVYDVVVGDIIRDLCQYDIYADEPDELYYFQFLFLLILFLFEILIIIIYIIRKIINKSLDTKISYIEEKTDNQLNIEGDLETSQFNNIQHIMQEANCNQSIAIKALDETNGDTINAINIIRDNKFIEH
jgi:NACalpha-BTF3-like transcription factor